MRTRIFEALLIAGLLIVSIYSVPAYAQGGNRNLVARFNQNYQKSYNVYLGVNESKALRDRYKAAHAKVVNAIRANNDVLFNNALLEFMKINREMVFGSAQAAEWFTHGAGPNGTSAANAANGFNAGMSVAIAYGRRHANSNTMICAYMFGEEVFWFSSTIKNCTLEAGDKLFDALSRHRITLSNFLQYVSG